MVNNMVLAAGLAIAALGGVAFVFAGGNGRADARRASLQKTDAKANAAATDRASKKKQITDKRQFYMISVGVGVAVAVLVLIKSSSLPLAGLCGVMAALGLPNFVLSRLRNRRINKFVDIFPNALDIIVRGVKAGLPLGDTLRIVANEAPEPVRGEFRKVVESQTLGLPLPEAAEKLAQRVPVSETNFFSIVIGIQSKSGGNLSEAIGNLSHTLRERKKMKGKIKAMAMEAKASAFIIGAVPFVVTLLLYLSSPRYISLLWVTQHGRIVAAIACFWMSIGVVMMRKMINFDF
jgi:tight adherence protein B